MPLWMLLRAAYLIVAITIATSSQAQMIPTPRTRSIEVHAANAERIVVGIIQEVSPPSGHREEPEKFLVTETLKGRHEPVIQVNIQAPIEDLADWKWARTELLVFIGRDGVYAGHFNLSDKKLAVPTADFRILRSGGELLRHLRSLSLNTAAGPRGEFPRRPPDGEAGKRWQEANENRDRGELLVPIDQRLEQWAQAGVRSKSPETRLEAVRALAYFKSEENVRILKSLFNDPGYRVNRSPEDNMGIEERSYFVREVAYQILRSWGERVTPPKTVETLSRLTGVTYILMTGHVTAAQLEDLAQAKRLTSLEINSSNTLGEEHMKAIGRISGLTRLRIPPLSVTDQTIQHLSGLRKLKVLSIDRNAIGDEALMVIAKLPELEELYISETEVTDRGITALRTARPNLKVRPPFPVAAIHVFASMDDVAGVSRILDRTPEAIRQEGGVMANGTPLHTAAYNNASQAVKLLLQRGADVNARNSGGDTPLMSGVTHYDYSPDTLRMLLAMGANPNLQNSLGQTPLHRAVWGYRGSAGTRLLLACGADPNIRDKEGRLPGVAAVTVRNEIKELLDAATNARRNPPVLVAYSNAACPKQVYMMGFEDNLRWSTSPTGALSGPLNWRRTEGVMPVLGPLGQQSVTLKLADLPKHSNVTIEFDLHIVGSWDGNGGWGAGPDLLRISVDGVGNLLYSSFYNDAPGDAQGLPMQSYPQVYLQGFNRGGTGADATRTHLLRRSVERSSVYRMKFTFRHDSPALELVFQGLTVPESNARDLLHDEYWEIGSLTVHTDGSAGDP